VLSKNASTKNTPPIKYWGGICDFVFVLVYMFVLFIFKLLACCLVCCCIENAQGVVGTGGLLVGGGLQLCHLC